MRLLFSKKHLFCSALISVLLLFPGTGCENKAPRYVTIITTMQKQDTAEIVQELRRTGRAYQIVPADTAYIHKNISRYIIPLLYNLECVDSIKDVSNKDSSIILVGINEDFNADTAAKLIRHTLESKRSDLPVYLFDPEVVTGKLGDNKR